MANKDLQQQDAGGRKNDEEVGEPIQLDDDKPMKQDQKKPDTGGQHEDANK